MSVLFSVTIVKFILAITRTNPRNLLSLYRIVSRTFNSSNSASPVYPPTEKWRKFHCYEKKKVFNILDVVYNCTLCHKKTA